MNFNKGPRTIFTDEVIPHHYGTGQNGPSKRAPDGIRHESDAGGRTITPAVESARLGCARMPGESFGHSTCVTVLRQSAATIMALFSLPVYRTRDRAGQGVGQHEKVSVQRAPHTPNEVSVRW